MKFIAPALVLNLALAQQKLFDLRGQKDLAIEEELFVIEIGELTTIVFSEVAGTGAHWFHDASISGMRSTINNVMTEVDQTIKYQGTTGVVGGPQVVEFVFEGTNFGEQVLNFVWARPWEFSGAMNEAKFEGKLFDWRSAAWDSRVLHFNIVPPKSEPAPVLKNFFTLDQSLNQRAPVKQAPPLLGGQRPSAPLVQSEPIKVFELDFTQKLPKSLTIETKKG